MLGSSSPVHTALSQNPRRSPHARGFTLTELLAVLALLAILTVAAAPAFVSMMRDRRANRAAVQIYDMYRLARMRSLGRGIPVLVTWDSTGGPTDNTGVRGLLVLQEPVVTTLAFSSTCATTTWAAPGLTPLPVGATQEVARFAFGNGLYKHTYVSFLDELGGPQAQSEVCYDGRSGRAYVRYTMGAGAFTPVTGVPRALVDFDQKTAGEGTLTTAFGKFSTRTVFLPPNGVARIGL